MSAFEAKNKQRNKQWSLPGILLDFTHCQKKHAAQRKANITDNLNVVTMNHTLSYQIIFHLHNFEHTYKCYTLSYFVVVFLTYTSK